MKQMIRVKVTDTDPILKNYRGSTDQYLEYGYGNSLSIGTLKSMIQRLAELNKQYRDRFQDMAFEAIRDCGCYSDCSCSPSYILYGKRYETDIEYKFRLDQEAARANEQEKRERIAYEALKKKFEKD